ncbi:hypothetical protein SARC_06670 [Sphaeroforma arctica JP610]|uniref:beta-N-acetylhexosaminidase n=1 Tax=Sphaeroforma arctica JP610 TaxID=667725 RepID=A0A0L0FVV7_9EUKA|nr:hypothetical protein SARC_06670 [Sphaeroforma arctica JP610]KNC80980.1 hypothetical protein SARC_06670 [Sphaeroforma arctica JP610]|eukprot:XP_014154882.1 hypothetical protein SARC_06670 [Sphaeroforma arctica JP610]
MKVHHHTVVRHKPTPPLTYKMIYPVRIDRLVIRSVMLQVLASVALAIGAAELASKLKITFDLHEATQPSRTCANADSGLCFMASIFIEYFGDDNMTEKDWAIHFSNIRMLMSNDNAEFNITHTTGDHHIITPTDAFEGFSVLREKHELVNEWEYWMLFQTDVMPKWYVVDRTGAAAVINNTNTETLGFYSTLFGDNVNGYDQLTKDTDGMRYITNEAQRLNATQLSDVRIIPKPLNTTRGSGQIDVNLGFNLLDTTLPEPMREAITLAFDKLGTSRAIQGHEVSVTVDPDGVSSHAAHEEGYEMILSRNGSFIRGYDVAGAFYGVMSLIGLIRLPETTIPEVAIIDAPRFATRGAFCDVARNFHSKAAVLRLLDVMAAYKLNHFHIHLSDDEGFRLAIPALPELTSIGSKRCYDPLETNCLTTQLGAGPYNSHTRQYYTVTEYVDILRYAAARNIEVITEIDMPGHSRAAVVSMSDNDEYRLHDPNDTSILRTVQFYGRESLLNPCVPGSRKWTQVVVAAVKDMYTQAGLEMHTWHYGGDEVINIYNRPGYTNVSDALKDSPFEKSPACKKRIEQRNISLNDITHVWGHDVSELLRDEDVTNMQAWSDGFKGRAHDEYSTYRTTVNLWETVFWGADASASEFNHLGHDVLLSCPDFTYFDMPYERNPKERGYYWASRSSNTRKVFGIAPENLPQTAEYTPQVSGEAYTVKSSDHMPDIKGITAGVWSETVRTDDQFEHMMFPRLLAIAERAWHRAEWELEYVPLQVYGNGTAYVDQAALQVDTEDFMEVLGSREMDKLAAMGIHFRVAPPGIKYTGRVLSANHDTPSASIEVDLGTGYLEYTRPLPLTDSSAVIKARAVHAGEYSRVIVLDVGECECATLIACRLNATSFENTFSCD